MGIFEHASFVDHVINEIPDASKMSQSYLKIDLGLLWLRLKRRHHSSYNRIGYQQQTFLHRDVVPLHRHQQQRITETPPTHAFTEDCPIRHVRPDCNTQPHPKGVVTLRQTLSRVQISESDSRTNWLRFDSG
ncbi:hypothetical protein NPIL_625501 [Nephila pilipes]|uniref:Uncharacterized protein n=1 Tax=Nephila pilipes TaxID=299642 RepID=A0A8X6PMZ5_NEPPI|nr:hypothetical protein NPIL_625501 [Nephila pilipes]